MELISRDQSIQSNLIFYFTGAPCKNGHVCERYTNNGKCKICRTLVRNKTAKAYYLANKEKINQNAYLWHEENKEKVKTKTKKYYHKNATYYKTRARIRDKRIKRAVPSWINLVELQKFYTESTKLTQETGIRYHVDHICPLKSDIVCGLHVPWNLQVITAKENLSLRNKWNPLTQTKTEPDF